MKNQRYRWCVYLILCHSSTLIYADANTDLAKKSQNPVENMISVPFNSNFNFGYGPHNNTQYILEIKPVVPFSLTQDWNLITRTILPVMRQPTLLHAHSYVNGIGDINPSLFLSPARPGTIIWGLGPTFVFPTASDKELGRGKYSLGPTFVVLAMPKEWVIGFLTYNIWSIAGQSGRPHVNSFELQYFINYNFPHGWFITSSPVITADWTATVKNRWTVPFGLGVGRVFNIGKQPINMSIQAYDNVITPRKIGPAWQLELDISLLFPH